MIDVTTSHCFGLVVEIIVNDLYAYKNNSRGEQKIVSKKIKIHIEKY